MQDKKLAVKEADIIGRAVAPLIYDLQGVLFTSVAAQ
jgi:hypothetical protein